MKILVITQKIDKDDPVLGFFHNWVKHLSLIFEDLTAICLYKGDSDLPAGVRVFSLGKETRPSRIRYLMNFFRYILSQRDRYDAVFIHMNQEYVLLGGLIWRILGKKIFLWRNHHHGNLLTRLSVILSHKVFCTSKYSYTAKFSKTVLMPVGIDTQVFEPEIQENRVKNSILSLGRISPVKKIHVFIEALNVLHKSGVPFAASIYGDPSPLDFDYYEMLKNNVKDYGLESKITFEKGVRNRDTVSVYSRHELFVNLSSSGMYDKTIFEAMACGSLVIASNKNLDGLIDPMFLFKEDDERELADKIKNIMEMSEETKESHRKFLLDLVRNNHSLDRLMERIRVEITGTI